MEPSVSALRYFHVLAGELHFGRAAARLHIASPSLSQQIARLEAVLGVRLFDRSSRGVTLTEDGRSLLPVVERLLADHDAVLAWARTRNDGATPLLRVGVAAAGAGALTTRVLAAAMERLPGLRLQMRRLGFFDAPDRLHDGTVDVALVPAPLAARAGIRSRVVLTEPRVLVVRATHPLAGRTSVSIGEVADEVFVTASGGSARAVDWWVVDPRPDGSHPRRGPVADDIEGILELCAAGAGVNIAAASAAVQYRRDSLAFVPVDDIAPASILLCALEQSDNPAVRAFEELMLSASPTAV